MTLGRQLKAAARLDLGDVARSRWPLFALGAYALLASVLVLVGMRESAVLGFTGMSRVVLSFAHVLLLILPLLALAATVQVIARAREDGTLELLFSQPLSRTAYVLAVTATRYLALTVPLVAILLVMTLGAAIFAPGAAPWGMSLRAAAVSAALLWAFVGVGMAVSVGTRNQARAIVLGLTIWAASVALLDLALVGVLLTWRVDALALFVLAASNPVQSARLALLSGIEPDLGTLGPVGFFLSQRVGSGALLVLGLAWPVLVGTAAWLWALRTFRRGDLV